MNVQRFLPERQFASIAFSILITICSVRVLEYVTIANKSFLPHAWLFEMAGLVYDIWIGLIYCFVMFIVFRLFTLVNKSAAIVVFHVFNMLLIVCYLALIITFSERTTPFDHEFFIRNSEDSFKTMKQMMTIGFRVYLPFILFILAYFLFYYKFFRKKSFSGLLLKLFGFLVIASVCGVKYSNPSPDWFERNSAFYLVSNKLGYWLHDSYDYLTTKDTYINHQWGDPELKKEIEFYQENQPFTFTNSEYPLMHKNTDPDVLGSFFNFNKTLPNIVILVVEGLSSDFSGENAYSGSFTPFLDSLSRNSLTWDNFLSTAPGTFAAHPAISGSLPYGKKGFSIMNIMPDHLSLIRILKSNGYFTSFMIGFNPDFDNMGGYIRAQGTDFILSHYGPQYKKMGIGKEGWSMGYPDDALYRRSMDALDSINKTPYLNIYHTGTTHLPYLFEQAPIYRSLFDKKLNTMAVSPDMKRTLRQTKDVLITFMFSDDCLRKFFTGYEKRPEFGNTIFLITGDHHIGSFPSTSDLDDYHVPFIIYSPLLKNARRFHSINSHNNITPTILAMLSNNFNLPYKPSEVHWLGDVMDTSESFRNIHSMPFMEWSRKLSQYIYKDYFISGNLLYRIKPNLLMERYTDDSVKKHMIRLRENFKVINSYVCENNKVYSMRGDQLAGPKELLREYTDSSARLVYSDSSDARLVPFFRIPEGYRYLSVDFSAEVNIPYANIDSQPTIRFSLVDTKNENDNYLYCSKRDIITLSKSNFIPEQWNAISFNDLFSLEDFKKVSDLSFESAIYTERVPVNVRIRKMKIRMYGVR